VASVDRERIEAAVSELLAAIGDDPAREGLVRTPQRVGELYAELFSGVGVDPASALGSTFDPSPLDAGSAGEMPAGQPVLLRGIAFRSVCEHHLLPFEGVAHVAYVPSGRVAGLGSVIAVVESASARPQLQERLGDDIANALQRGLGASGVLVVLDARHGCVTARGSRQTGTTAVTVTARGSLADPAARGELLGLIGSTG
jgi:GTP cyclohydrolase I